MTKFILRCKEYGPGQLFACAARAMIGKENKTANGTSGFLIIGDLLLA
ncbi:hypothetical protein [Polaromonas sp. UBA4122]|nr:hypothetical protein [Polaromonas sp. UBA4122]